MFASSAPCGALPITREGGNRGDSIQGSSRRDLLKAGGALIVRLAFRSATGRSMRIAETGAEVEASGADRGRFDPLLSTREWDCRRSTPARSTSAPESRQRSRKSPLTSSILPMSKVRIVQGDTELTPDQGTTWGSLRSRSAARRSAKASAAARAKLFSSWPITLGVAARRSQNRRRRHQRRGQKREPFAQLTRGKSFSITLDLPKCRSQPRIQSTCKVVGTVGAAPRHPRQGVRFVHLCARFQTARACCTRSVVRPPCHRRGSCRAVDEASVAGRSWRQSRSFEKSNFLAVVAEHPSGARSKVPQKLKAELVEAGRGCPTPAKLWEHVRATEVVRRRSDRYGG